MVDTERTKSIMSFILSERFISLTVIGSIFTFAFIASLKGDIIDPLLHFALPEENFGFMDITIRDGEKLVMPPRRIEIRLGNFFREFITWIFAVSILYMLAVFTRFPDTPGGNCTGAAIM